MNRRSVVAACWVSALLMITMHSAAAQEVRVAPPASSHPQSTGEHGSLRGSDDNGRAPLQRVISLDLRRVSLREALTTIAAKARVTLIYTSRVVPLDRTVSARLRNSTVQAALDSVLTGTEVEARSAGEQIILSKRQRANDAASGDGTIYGRVTDTLTSRPLRGAVVSVSGVAPTTTNDDGVYSVRHVPAGLHTVAARLVGYVPAEQKVVVADSQAVRLDFALRMGMTRLQEVVITATGPRRRLELGNDITILNADSIVATQPIRSVTDILATRVPGLAVLATSGVPGDPSRLRLRGVSSILESNDPIVIVDGIRVYSNQSSQHAAKNLAAGAFFAVPSPIDQIDPNSIEKIEVLKGPSAATLYGQDAANGVIVITTKRGKAGPPRWTISVDRGVTKMPGSYPTNYLRFGHYVADDEPRLCSIQDFSCVTDSVVRFQLLNDPRTTILARGYRSAVTAGVSGGTSSLTYAVTGDISDELGITSLPEVLTSHYRAAHFGTAPPDWMQRPDAYRRWGATTQLTAQLGSKASVALTAMLGRGTQQRSNLDLTLGGIMGTYYDAATSSFLAAQNAPPFGSGFALNPVLSSQFYTKVEDVSTTNTDGLTFGWQPRSWLQASADAGLQLTSRDDQSLEPHGANPPSDTAGAIGIGRGQTLVRSVNVRATATATLPADFRLQTSIGANYLASSTNDLIASSLRGLAAGITALSGDVDATENAAEVATFGWYVEPAISNKRFFLSTGLRLDGGSTFGTHVTLPAFPKLNLSYLISDERWYPRAIRPALGTLRLRLAYGRAGTWPGPEDKLRLFTQSSQWVDSALVTATALRTLGNTQLRPERSTEFEGGFDADLIDNRISISFTSYRKMRYDALLPVPLPPSVGGAGTSSYPATVLKNIGVVRNAGLELTLTLNPIRGELFEWSADLNVSRNHNVVVALAPGVTPFSSPINGGGAANVYAYERVAAGYPLFGVWAKPILGYDDRNGDGVIEPGEVLVGDTLVYFGEAVPNYMANLHTSVGLLRHALTIDAVFGYQNGITQLNVAALNDAAFSEAMNTPHSNLGAQAAVAATDRTIAGVLQTVSTMRLTSLAVRYGLPAVLVKRLGASAMSIALQGTNLGLWSNYRGKDPGVNANVTGNAIADTGVLPEPRTWQLRVQASF